ELVIRCLGSRNILRCAFRSVIAADGRNLGFLFSVILIIGKIFGYLRGIIGLIGLGGIRFALFLRVGPFRALCGLHGLRLGLGGGCGLRRDVGRFCRD